MSARRPDLTLFLPSLRGGGAERVMIDLARTAAEAGRAVDVVILNSTGALLEPPVDLGVRVIDLGSRRAAEALGPLRSYLVRERPPVVLSTMLHTNVLAVAAGLLASGHIRIIVRQPSMPAEGLATVGWKRALMWPLVRWAYRHADTVVAVSHGVADALVHDLGVPVERIEVIYNPVITPRLRQGAREEVAHRWFAPGTPPIVLGVGRLVAVKGFDVLIDAVAEAQAEAPCRLVVLGDGPLRAELMDRARERGIADRFDLPGFADNPFAYMAHCGVFVLSSRNEGLPNALIQALAVGARVVATDCRSGPREILDDGALGQLVPVDDHEAMARAIVSALHAPAPRPPDAWFARFDAHSVSAAYLSLLEP